MTHDPSHYDEYGNVLDDNGKPMHKSEHALWLAIAFGIRATHGDRWQIEMGRVVTAARAGNVRWPLVKLDHGSEHPDAPSAMIHVILTSDGKEECVAMIDPEAIGISDVAVAAYLDTGTVPDDLSGLDGKPDRSVD